MKTVGGILVTQHSVTFDNASAAVSLCGTLTLPDSGPSCPAAILVHGQGALDRDMSFAHLKPFKTLAEHLAANGIASLRYDKRGVGESGGDFGSVTREDLASDVSAALGFLKRREAIDPNRIGLIGQSEGGVVAPMVASASDDVAFVVLLAGPAVSGRENLGLSFAMFAQASPANDLRVPDFKRLMDRLLDLVGSDSPRSEDQAAVAELAESVTRHVVNERTNIVFGGAEVTADQFIGFLSSPCLRETVESEPGACLSVLACPTLALFAEKDKHVPAAENAMAMQRFLEAAGNLEYTVETIAGTNHLFQRCETGYPDEYLTIDHDISSDVLDRVSGWITGMVRGE
jgi:pimeloyl-ACP methyl ester carboxylesterase